MENQNENKRRKGETVIKFEARLASERLRKKQQERAKHLNFINKGLKVVNINIDVAVLDLIFVFDKAFKEKGLKVSMEDLDNLTEKTMAKYQQQPQLN